MGKIDYLAINLDKPDAVYFPGQLLTGNIKFRVKDRLKINSVWVWIGGVAKCHWIESRPINGHMHTLPFSNKETYIDSTQILISKQGNDDDLYLEPNDYTYPFSLTLPYNLPSSFEHRTGYIVYLVKTKIDIPWASDKQSEKYFTLVNQLDLNRLAPDLNEPKQVSESKSVLLSTGGPITFTFKTNKAGYVSGERILCSASVNNQSSRDVKETRIKLVQQIEFRGVCYTPTAFGYRQENTHKESRSVVDVTIMTEIPGKTSQEIQPNEQFIIPSVCPSSIPGLCKIINVSYYLMFSLSVRGSTDKEVYIPITIGTIPFGSNEQEMFSNSLFKESLFDCIERPILNDNNEESDGNNNKGETYETNETTYKPIYPNVIGFI